MCRSQGGLIANVKLHFSCIVPHSATPGPQNQNEEMNGLRSGTVPDCVHTPVSEKNIKRLALLSQYAGCHMGVTESWEIFFMLKGC